MDDRLEDEHDFKKAVSEIELDDDRAAARAKRRDAEIAYEVLAVDASMGMFGMEESVAELMRLAMAQEIMYKLKTSDSEHKEYND